MLLKLAIPIFLILLILVFLLDFNNKILYEDHISIYERPNQKTYNIIIPIKNKSIKNISISKIATSCGCTKIEYPKTIYPFSTKNIVATISIDHADISKKIHVLGYLKTGQNINIQLNYIPVYSIANKPDIINIGHYKESDFPIKIESFLGHSAANKNISIRNQDE